MSNKWIQKITVALLMAVVLTACKEKTEEKAIEYPVTLMIVDPGHFHASLVQKYMYEDVSPDVYVYAPEGEEVNDYLATVASFNDRPEDPTQWNQIVYTGNDFFNKMLEQKPGNVMVVSGNNAKKTEYINQASGAGIHVLADKPMVIKPDEYNLLADAIADGVANDIIIYDIMTERYEITTILQKKLSQSIDLFGELIKGTDEEPAITKESVHYFYKYVAGSPLKRPPWFFDISQQGEGLVDVSTHLVDLVLWECHSQEILTPDQVKIRSASHWPTELTPAQFEKVTHYPEYPDYLQPYVKNDSILNVYSNGEATFRIKDITARISVKWDFQAPEGGKDTHYSIMRGSRADLIIEQGKEQDYKPVLYVENKGDVSLEELEQSLSLSLENINGEYPGVSYTNTGERFEIIIPEKYKVGHEAHFSQVTEKFLEYLNEGALPDWEVAFMLTKYYITTQALKVARDQ